MKIKERKHSSNTACTVKIKSLAIYNSAEYEMTNFGKDFQSFYQGHNISNIPRIFSARVSNPYVIQYKNTSTKDVTAYLFGYNDYADEVNYGNPAAVIISNLQGKKYKHLIKQSKKKNFKISKWRFQSSSEAQLQQTLQIYHIGEDGRQYVSPMNLRIMRDPYQHQLDILDLTKSVKIDKNTIISFTLKAGTNFVVTMFPESKLSRIAHQNLGQRNTPCKYCKFAR